MSAICAEARKWGQKMISYETLLAQLEKYVEQAKLANNEQQFREALVAVSALCDVALQLPTNAVQPLPKVGQSEQIAHVNLAQLTGQSTLKEDDANGESIFDF